MLNSEHRREVDNIIADIARMRSELPAGVDYGQAEDREAFEIVRRIERRLMGLERKPAEIDGSTGDEVLT